MKYIMFYFRDIIPYMLIAALFILSVRFYKYKRYKNNSVKTEILIFIFYLYLIAVFLKTVVPSEILRLNFTSNCFMLPNRDSVYNNPAQSYIYIRSFVIEGLWFRLFHVFILNLILLVPFGILFPLLYPKQKDKTILIGFLISCSIEFLQLFTDRLTDTFDIFLNTLGVIIGYMIYKLIMKIKERRKA